MMQKKLQERFECNLSHLATSFEKSKGRLHPEEESYLRSPFQRDRDRIIHATAFRRLKYKTQVFVCYEGDYYRTRLSHSLEVAQVARTMARTLCVDEDLVEALSLAHDLGHTPFGHAGEKVLNECMLDAGGFDHNAQTLRVVQILEKKYRAFEGLNLTFEALEGLAKHSGPIKGGLDSSNIRRCIFETYKPLEVLGMNLDSFGSVEAQISSISDDIAYNTHDIEDGLRAGFFTIEELRAIPLIRDSFLPFEIRELEDWPFIYESLRRFMGFLIQDVLFEVKRRVGGGSFETCEDVQKACAPLVEFSQNVQGELDKLRNFLFERMYRHANVLRVLNKSQDMLRKLFELLARKEFLLPSNYRDLCDGPNQPKTLRVVCDYIASMTDRSALREYKALFDLGELL